MDYLKKENSRQNIIGYCQAEGMDYSFFTYSIYHRQKQKKASRIRTLLVRFLTFNTVFNMLK